MLSLTHNSLTTVSRSSRPLVDFSNPLDNPNSSLSAENADPEPTLSEIAEDIWEAVVEDLAEEMMAEQLAQEHADEEDEEEEAAQEKAGNEGQRPDVEVLRNTTETRESDENADWRPVVRYQGQEWNLA